MTDAEIHCFECGNDYRYLGCGLHPGRCPTCESHCVSPAGDVTVLATTELVPFDPAVEVGVLAKDERLRQFLYYFDAGSELRALMADGHFVQTATVTTRVHLPSEVLDSASRAVPSRPEGGSEGRE